MKVDLTLVEFGAAREDIEAFLSDRFCELISDQETQDLVERLTIMLSGHNDRIRDLLQVPKLDMEGVSQRVTLGMSAQQPLEADFFPGILEGLVSSLGLAPLGATNLPTSVREGVTRYWVAALREAVGETEPGIPGQDLFNRVLHGLCFDYNLYFWSRRFEDIAPTFLSPLLPKRVGNILLPRGAPSPERPRETQQEQTPAAEGVFHESR